jgi:uncharacterized protein (DUF58 family)
MPSLLFSESFLRQLEHLALLYHRSAISQMQGERRSTKRGQSVEFSDFRPYTLGDDFRRIDWNAYARLERLFIKLFVEEQDLTVHLLIDGSLSMDWGSPNKLEYATRAAAAIGYIALVGLDRVTATVLRDSEKNGSNAPNPLKTIPPIRGKKNALALFNFLQKVVDSQAKASKERQGRPYGGPVKSLINYAGSAVNPGPLVLISDLMDDGWQPGLSRLAGRGFEITLLHILSPDEFQPDMDGDFKLLDAETDAVVEISANFETLERYRQLLSAWQASWGHFCASRGMHYVPVDTSITLEDLLFARLPLQGVLK